LQVLQFVRKLGRGLGIVIWRTSDEEIEMRVEHVLETCLYVGDLDAAEAFYRDVLGLELVSRQAGRHLFFRCGKQMLLLFNPVESARVGEHFPPHGATGLGHVAFGVGEATLAEWMRQLERCQVAIERVIDWPGGGQSVYFRDPAGNSLELATPRIWGISEETLVARTG
jgi:catechol 2,3-dioxygenase-like lactoylglutathione lyase family enzyme